ncbi:MAG: cell division protein FtsZ, partial [Polymorphobacter sp.]
INITGGDDLRLMEVDEAATHIRDMVDPDANIIVGSAFNKDLEGIMRVSVVATGIDAASRPNAVVPRARPAAAPAGFAAQPSIFAAPAAVAPPPVPEATTSAPAADEIFVAPAAMAPKPDAAGGHDDDIPEATIDTDDEIGSGADARPIDAMGGPDSFRFAPSDPTPAVATDAVEPSLAAAALSQDERAPTLFEKMMNLSRGPRPKPASTTLAPEPPIAGAPDVEIPPFFKRQANN